ncbi:MAG TPA: tetratricopeptide repeat protein, partial [Verrucomicrobiae bacterium]|nr:tetratricopeptide repeat protein [Verrucomicrobiae bacterium]
WASERKDVLSAFFWMLTLLCYAAYSRNVARCRPRSRGTGGTFAVDRPTTQVALPAQRAVPALFYLLALLFFACGLMSKPMVVTLPFVLLLLDFWPLQRFKTTDGTNANERTKETQGTYGQWGRLVAEKIPYILLSLAGCVVTYRVQEHGGAVINEPLSFRISNALWAYERYLAKVLWPSELAIVYPLPEHGLILLAVQSGILLFLCSMLFVVLARRLPYLFVGWFWFLGILVPVIGIVQVGAASMADRYTYVPSIGLFIAVAWGLESLVRSPRGKMLLTVAAIAALGACVVLTSMQITFWRNSITLFRHALAVTTDNYVACACLGQALYTADDNRDALVYCNEAVRINPEYPAGQFFLAQALWKIGSHAEAISHINAAAQGAARDSGFQYNLGKFLLDHGETDAAIARFTAAQEVDPEFAEAHNALGKAYLQQGAIQKATDELSQAIKLDPDNPQYHYDLGTVLLNRGQIAQATAEFTTTVRLQPNFALAHENLAVALANQGNMAEAIEHFEKTVQLQPNDPEAHFNLGFAYLNNHQMAEAAGQFTAESRLTPNEPKAHYRLAQAMRDQNEFPAAVSEYRQTLRLEPGFAAAKQELDEILAAHPELR